MAQADLVPIRYLATSIGARRSGCAPVLHPGRRRRSWIRRPCSFFHLAMIRRPEAPGARRKDSTGRPHQARQPQAPVPVKALLLLGYVASVLFEPRRQLFVALRYLAHYPLRFLVAEGLS